MDVMPDEVAAWAAYAPVDDVAPALLERLDPAQLSVEGRLDLARGLERLKAWADALQMRTLAALAAEPPALPHQAGKEFVREEIAAALHWSPATASSRLHEAQRLVETLPATLELLGAAEIGYLHARAVTDAVVANRLDDAGAAALERRVLPDAAGRTVAELRRRLRRAVIALDPPAAQQQHADAAAERRVSLRADEHAMAWLSAYLPAVDAQTVWTAIQAVADSAGRDDDRDEPTADHRRADALTSLATTALATGQLVRQQGRRPAVQVSVALSTLLGLDEQPAELDDYGPLPAELARPIAADPTGTWTRLVTDDIGRLLDHGRTRYKPPQDLTEHVIARDRTCRHPGCARTARRCQLDHVRAWADGGATNAENLQTLCTRHHALKHEAGWTVTRAPDGRTTWTTPTGAAHTTPPETYPVDRTLTVADPDPPPSESVAGRVRLYHHLRRRQAPESSAGEPLEHRRQLAEVAEQDRGDAEFLAQLLELLHQPVD
jgi:Domain of unknown function (DUF222)/HNH endonuclease